METKKEDQEEIKGQKSVNKDIEANKWWAVLSYLGVLVIIPLLGKKNSEFTQFHVKQGLVLLVGWFLTWLPFGAIIGFFAFILSIVGIVNVLSGEMSKLPVVGDLAEKIKM